MLLGYGKYVGYDANGRRGERWIIKVGVLGDPDAPRRCRLKTGAMRRRRWGRFIWIPIRAGPGTLG